MRNLRQICAAAVLTLALALSVFAGQIQCPGAPEPAPGNIPSDGAPGEIPTDGSTSPGDIPTVGIVLTILDLVF
jgi:hypothetical protein